ncbi:MAG: hypothetical protein ABL903_14150 [Methylococcales bacterium]
MDGRKESMELDGIVYVVTRFDDVNGFVYWVEKSEDGTALESRQLTDAFVTEALLDAINYNDTGKLLRAIRLGLHELLEGDNREALALIFEGKHKGKGKKGSQARRNDKRNNKLWARLNFLKGAGLPVIDNASEEDAVSKVAKEFHCGRKAVINVWTKYGGNNPNAINQLGADVAFHKGKQIKI